MTKGISDSRLTALFKQQSVSFGAEIYRIRIALGLSQSDIAAKARIARGYYSQIENSKKIPPPSRTVDRIADALSVDKRQAQILQDIADAERCAAVNLPPEMPQVVACFIRKVSTSAHSISPEKLQRMTAVLEEGCAM